MCSVRCPPTGSPSRSTSTTFDSRRPTPGPHGEGTMDDLSKARRKWKRAEDAVEGAQARLKVASGTQGADAARKLAEARKDLEEAEDDQRRAKRKYRRLRDQNAG